LVVVEVVAPPTVETFKLQAVAVLADIGVRFLAKTLEVAIRQRSRYILPQVVSR